jgi:hypothetical protein
MANQGSNDRLGKLRRLAALVATDGHRFSTAKLTRILEIAEGEDVVEDRKEHKNAETKLATYPVHENRPSTTRQQQSDQVASKTEAETVCRSISSMLTNTNGSSSLALIA